MSSKVKRKVTVENNETSEQPRRQSVFERLGPGNVNVSSQSQERSSRGEQMEKCWNWLKTGKCTFGSSCRYKHDSFPSSKRSKWDKDIDKKDLRHKVRNKREATKETTAESNSPKRRGRKRSSSRNRRNDHDSKMKSTVVVTRPRSPASETEFRDKKRIQEASWEDDSDDWPVDAAQLDYKEELTLERKRQQLQRELELEIQKERMVNENVTITKTVSVSGSSSSSSDSDSESSSSDSSSSSSGDSDDSSSSSSSSSESSPVRPKKQIVNRETREKYHDVKSTLLSKEKEQLPNRSSKPHGTISHTSTLSPDPANRKRWKDKVDPKAYSQKTISGSRSEGTLIGRKSEYHNIEDDVPSTSANRSKGPRTPSPNDGRRPKQRSLVSSSFENKPPRSRSKRRKKRRDPASTDDINYGELHPPSTPPPLSSPNRMSVAPFYPFGKPKAASNEKVQLRPLESSSYTTTSRLHGQRGNIIPPHEKEYDRENRRNFAASPEMDKRIDRKLIPRDTPWQRIEQKLPREEEQYNKGSPLRHGNERKRIPPKKRDLSSHRDSPLVKEKMIESPPHRIESQRKPLSHESSSRNIGDRRRRSLSPIKDREDREREEREREREEREREREREREEREREEREREEREREEREREEREREKERRRIAEDAERKKGPRSESLSRVKPPRDPAVTDNYAGKKDQSRRVPSPEGRRLKGGSSKDVKNIPSKSRSTNSNEYWNEEGKQLPGKPLHRVQETRSQPEVRHHHQSSERPEPKERIVDRGRKRERDKSRTNIRDESRSDKLKPRSPTSLTRTQSPYRGHCPLRGAEITTPPTVRDRRYDRDVSLGREHGYVYGNKNMNEGRYVDDRYGMHNEPVADVCRNPMYSPEQYRDTRYRREMGQPTDRYGNYIGKDPHGMNSRVETGYIQDIHMDDPLTLDDRWGRNRQLPRDNWDNYGGMMDTSMSLMPSLSSGSEMQRIPYDPVEEDRYPVRSRHTDWSGSRQDRPERQEKRDRIHSPSTKSMLPHRQEPKDQKPLRLSPAVRTHSPADFSPASGASEHSSHINKNADKSLSVKPKERQKTKVNRRQTRDKAKSGTGGSASVKTEKEKPSQTKKRQKSPSPGNDKEKKKKTTDDTSSSKKKEELKKESASPSSVSRKTVPTPPAEENARAPPPPLPPPPPPPPPKTVETPAKSEVPEKKVPKDNETAKIPDPEFSDWSEDDDDLLTQDISGEEDMKKPETDNGNNAEKTEEVKPEAPVQEHSDDKKESENKEAPSQEDNKQVATSKEINLSSKIIEPSNEDTSEMTLEEAVHYDPISDDELDAILGEQDDIDTKLSEATEKHDWDSLQNRSQDFVPGNARKRFTTAKVLAQIGFSQNLTGPELSAKILNYCNKQIKEERTANTEENGEDKTTLTELKMEHPIAAFHVIINANKEERANVLYNLGPYRHALCARQDLQMRRLLCKTTNKVVDSSNSYQNHTVDTELYKLSLDLWRQKTSSTQQMIPTS